MPVARFVVLVVSVFSASMHGCRSAHRDPDTTATMAAREGLRRKSQGPKPRASRAQCPEPSRRCRLWVVAYPSAFLGGTFVAATLHNCPLLGDDELGVRRGQIEQISRFSALEVDSVDAVGVFAHQAHLHWVWN